MSGEFAVNRDERGRNVVEPWLRPQSQTIDGCRRQICADRAQIHPLGAIAPRIGVDVWGNTKTADVLVVAPSVGVGVGRARLGGVGMCVRGAWRGARSVCRRRRRCSCVGGGASGSGICSVCPIG